VPAADPEFDSHATDRLTLFSDAVVAIAITLLAIELPVPSSGTTAAFLTSVKDDSGHYAAFLISFQTIAASWSAHHDVFQHTRRVDVRLRQLNMMWLFTIVLIPFATKLLTSPGGESLTVHVFQYGFYALVQTVKAAILLAMLRHMTTHGLSEDLPAAGCQEGDRGLLGPDGSLRAVDPRLIRHLLRMGAVDRGPGGRELLVQAPPG
jgi:uncharacterized membrane protein